MATATHGTGVRALRPHERATNEADAQLLRDAGDALNAAFNGLSTTDHTLEQLAEQLWERAANLEEQTETRL